MLQGRPPRPEPALILWRSADWWFHLLNTLAVLVVCSMHRSGDGDACRLDQGFHVEPLVEPWRAVARVAIAQELVHVVVEALAKARAFAGVDPRMAVNSVRLSRMLDIERRARPRLVKQS